MTIFYDNDRSVLSLNVHSAEYVKKNLKIKKIYYFFLKLRNLINVDKKSLSDPYARLLLLPDSSKETKRKTHVIKDSLNPIWEEIFEWTMTKAEVETKTLEINLKDDKSIFERQKTVYLGRVSIPYIL